jgi:hypothetical protein
VIVILVLLSKIHIFVDILDLFNVINVKEDGKVPIVGDL